MDYTKLPRYFVYKDRSEIDKFGVKSLTPKARRALESIGELPQEGIKSMDQHMYEAILKSAIIRLDGARKYVCDIFNTAYYITTLILMDENPMLNFRAYMNKADEVGAAPGCKNTYHDWFQGMTMAIVCNYLQALNPRYLDVDDFVELVNNDFTSRFSSQESINYSFGGRVNSSTSNAIIAHQLFFNNMLSETEVHSLAVSPKMFLPRPIEEALKESNYEDIYDNIEYITERINELSKGRQKRAVNILINTTQMTGEDALQGAMPEAAKHVRETMQDIFYAFGYKHVPQEQIGSPDKQKWKKDKAKEDTADANKGSLIEDQAAEIARMKANIERLQLNLEGKQKVDKNMPAHQAAILITALCRELKQMPNNREDLAPVLQYMWGFTKSTAEKALRRAFTLEEAKEVATHFNSITPKIARLIRELPQQLKEENEERLRELNKKNKKS